MSTDLKAAEFKAPNFGKDNEKKRPEPCEGRTWALDAEDAQVIVESWKQYIKANKSTSLAKFVQAEAFKDTALTEVPDDPSLPPAGSQLRYISAKDTVYIVVDPCNACHKKLLNYRQFLAEYIDLAGAVGNEDVAHNDDRPRFFFLLAPSARCICN